MTNEDDGRKKIACFVLHNPVVEL